MGVRGGYRCRNIQRSPPAAALSLPGAPAVSAGLSPKHLRGKPDQLRETLLHEMIHAWLYARGENPGHTPAFKRKMKELGLTSIYHDLGTAAPLNPSTKRYLLRCEKCGMELLRRRRPPANLMCARDRRELKVFEITGLADVEPARAARKFNGAPP